MVPRGDHCKLLTKAQDLQMEEGEGRLYLEDATVRDEKMSTGSISTTFPVGTGQTRLIHGANQSSLTPLKKQARFYTP